MAVPTASFHDFTTQAMSAKITTMTNGEATRRTSVRLSLIWFPAWAMASRNPLRLFWIHLMMSSAHEPTGILGRYCVPDETYFTENQVHKADEERHSEGQHLCPDCGRPLTRVQEESWFFRLSAFQDRLLGLYEEHPDFVMPSFRMHEVKSFVEGGLQDLSVSRTSFDWGIRLPFDEGHVTYVWFDALLNYMTAVGYGQPGEDAAAELARRWPAQYHVVGKDIIRFHCVIWPLMLLALGLEPPVSVIAHGWWTVDGEKMSKSKC